MRKANQEISDPKILEDILRQSVICRIAMIDDDKPYLLPFNYGYDQGAIYIHCAPMGKKLEVLKSNPDVCFEVEQEAELVKNELACKWATTYRSVVGYGKVETINDFEAKTNALNSIMKHNGAIGNQNFEEKQVNAILILKLTISSMTGKQSGNWDKAHQAKNIDLKTDRLDIKEIGYHDIENIHALHSIPEVDEFNTLGIPSSIDETRKLILPELAAKYKKPRKRFTMKILLRESGNFIGLAGISLSNDKFRLGEIYYKFNPKFWGNGYATEFAKRIIQFGFEDLKLHKIEAGVATENSRSVKVLEKAGMVREGLRRKILPIRGAWKDNYHYAICEEDFTEKKK